MLKSEQINELAVALNKAQSEMGSAKKDADNPFFKSRYADLNSVWEACRTALTKNGLSITQTMDIENGACILQTTLLHNSGQWLSSRFPLYPQDQKPQTLGSLISYARRYSLASILSIVQEDDDAEGAMNRVQNTYKKPLQTNRSYP